MTGADWAVLSPWIVVVLAGTVGGIWAFVNRRGGEKAKRRDMEPPSWEAVWAHMKETETQWKAKFAEQDAKLAKQAAEHAAEMKAARDEITLMRTTTAIKDRAVTNILAALANQWPKDSPPTLNQEDIDVLGDTMPHKFRPTRPQR